ncbi:ATP-binding protein [Actinocrinis sp.]|uniref:ATP-binding protein n=1 Tax=Actinocrinis sp. TaxID=1920516 RepID=UPI002D432106|nr:tetratricopeptide repeat protein [Actinocrinis sp.]HZP52882.1 tetratricopeptide repeat protein [Actinocrinis sp.]
MESGARQPGAGHTDPLVSAAATAATLEDLAALLRDLRRRHARSRRDSNLTYRELAARTGWSQTAIAEYFTARTLPPTDRFDALLEVLGATRAERGALATARDRIEEADRRTRRSRSGPRPAGAGASPAVTVVRAAQQLPAAPRTFTGRTRELAYLDSALEDQTRDDGTPVICAIGGMGGIGKTWLAVHWAHRHLDRFPDGQLYVNLRGFEPVGQPMTAAAVVRGFLEALGVPPAAVPVAPEAQAGLYRSLAAGRRMLILLDNARDTAQVTPLLPGDATCTVLITSRRQLTGLIATHGARSVALDVLPEDDARRLLARHLGGARLDAEPEATAALLDCCAGLPLALGIVAARATVHPHLTLAALAAELHESAHRLDGLDAGEPQVDLRGVLSWSSRALSPEVARAFGLLGIAPGPDLALAAAAALLGLPLVKTRTLLRTLEHAHLVQQHAPERYRMHDLLRLYASEQADEQHPPAELQAALRRLVDFYVHTAYAGAQLLAHCPTPLIAEPEAGAVTHPLPDTSAAIAWFDAEHGNLLAAQQLARAQGWDAPVYHLAWALDPYHRRRGHIAHQAETWQLAVASARQLPEQAARVQAQQMLGDAYAQLGRTTDALRSLRKALTLAEQAGDITSQAQIHHSLGGTWERHGDDDRALEHAHRALLIFQTLDDPYQQARALNGVGWLQIRLGKYGEARANCEAALALLRSLPFNEQRIGEANTLDSLGCVAHHLREYDQALDYYDQALTICRAQGHSYLEADILRHIAETRFAQRRLDQARGSWECARELYLAQHRLAAASRVQQQLDGLAP